MKFLVDRMLGKLAKQLRLLGYDAVYFRDAHISYMIQQARQETRTIITRNTRLVPRGSEDLVIWLTEDSPRLQLQELIAKGIVSFDEERVFSRCLICNDILDRLSRDHVEGKVADFVFCHHQEFFQCPNCRRIYWKGSHQERMKKTVQSLFSPSWPREPSLDADH